MDIQSKTINHNESEPNSSHKSEDKLILNKSLNTTEIKNAYLHKRPKIFKTKAKIQHHRKRIYLQMENILMNIIVKKQSKSNY